jgi:hypothetical protein
VNIKSWRERRRKGGRENREMGKEGFGELNKIYLI